MSDGIYFKDAQGLADAMANTHGDMCTVQAEWMAEQIFADRKPEAVGGEREAVEVVAHMYQHEETGLIGFVDQQQVDWGFQKNNPRLQLCGPLMTVAQHSRIVAELEAEIARGEQHRNDLADRITALRTDISALTAQQGASVAVPDGYALVPIEPPEGLEQFVCNCDSRSGAMTGDYPEWQQCYKAMLAAAPKPAAADEIDEPYGHVDGETCGGPCVHCDYVPADVGGLVEALRTIALRERKWRLEDIDDVGGDDVAESLASLCAEIDTALAAYKAQGDLN